MLQASCFQASWTPPRPAAKPLHPPGGYGKASGGVLGKFQWLSPDSLTYSIGIWLPINVGIHLIMCNYTSPTLGPLGPTPCFLNHFFMCTHLQTQINPKHPMLGSNHLELPIFVRLCHSNNSYQWYQLEPQLRQERSRASPSKQFSSR